MYSTKIDTKKSITIRETNHRTQRVCVRVAGCASILTFCKFSDGGAWGAAFVSFLTWTSLHSDKFTVKISFNCLPLFVHSIVFVNGNLVKENNSVCA